MIVISDILSADKKENRIDKSYYNAELDSESEYCQNTTAWD